MSKERVIGIDFGTSTSVVRVKNYDGKGKPIGGELFTETVKFNQGASMVPSVIRKVNDTYAFGHDAEVAARNAEYFRAFKIGLQSSDEAEKEQAKWLVQEFFKYIYNEYNHQLITGNLGDKDSVNKTIVSYPVKWDSDLEQFMLKAAENAGFENVSGMDEAEAAIRAITVQCKDIIKKSGLLEDGKPSNVMLIDMGAGTTDIVISKYMPGTEMKNEIITTWPKGGDILFGGQEVDVILRDFLVSRFPQEYREQIAKRLSVDKMKAWKENTISPILEEGKEAITESYEAYDLADRFDTDYEEFTLDRNSFEELCHDYIAQFVKLVSGAIEDAKLSPSDIDMVILTGGHSKWYFAKELLMDKNQSFEKLGLEKIKAEPDRILSVALPQETVALGLVYSKISGTLIFNEKETKQTDNSRSDTKTSADKPKASSPKPRVEQETEEPDKFKDNDPVEYARTLWGTYKDESFRIGALYIGRKNIPKEKLEAFLSVGRADLKMNSMIICYYDATIAGSGKEGFILTDDSLLWHGGFEESHYFKLSNVADFYINEANQLYLIDTNGGKFYLNDLGRKAEQMREFLLDMIEFLKDPEHTVKKTGGFKGSDPVEYAKYLCRNLSTPLNVGKIGDSISMSSVGNLLLPFHVHDIWGIRPIYFYDSTFFGSGKNGLLITDTTIYWRKGYSYQHSVDIKYISKFSLTNDKSNIYVHDKKGLKYLIDFFYNEKSNKEMLSFFKGLTEFIKQSNNNAAHKS